MRNEIKQQLQQVRELFVNTPYLTSLLNEIEECRQDSLLGGEPECVLITGNTGAGKTSLIQRYLDKHPREAQDDKTVISVLFTTLPENASPVSASQQMLKDLGDSFYYTSKNEVLLANRLVTLLRQCGTELIIIDEFQHMIERRSSRVLHRAADWLKTLIVRSNVPVAMFGMPHSRVILDSNAQLARRFMLQRQLKPFRVKNEKERLIFLQFLAILDDALPFSDSSHLASKPVAWPLYAVCRGNMGRLRKVINCAAKSALNHQHRKIELSDFVHAAEKLLDERLDNPFLQPLDSIDFQEPSDDVGWDDFFQSDQFGQGKDTKQQPSKLRDVF